MDILYLGKAGLYDKKWCLHLVFTPLKMNHSVILIELSKKNTVRVAASKDFNQNLQCN